MMVFGLAHDAYYPSCVVDSIFAVPLLLPIAHCSLVSIDPPLQKNNLDLIFSGDTDLVI